MRTGPDPACDLQNPAGHASWIAHTSLRLRLAQILVLNLVLVAMGVDDLITRNVIAILIPATVMLAGGPGARRAGLTGLAATLAL